VVAEAPAPSSEGTLPDAQRPGDAVISLATPSPSADRKVGVVLAIVGAAVVSAAVTFVLTTTPLRNRRPSVASEMPAERSEPPVSRSEAPATSGPVVVVEAAASTAPLAKPPTAIGTSRSAPSHKTSGRPPAEASRRTAASVPPLIPSDHVDTSTRQ
jgi:hypothetical protein